MLHTKCRRYLLPNTAPAGWREAVDYRPNGSHRSLRCKCSSRASCRIRPGQEPINCRNNLIKPSNRLQLSADSFSSNFYSSHPFQNDPLTHAFNRRPHRTTWGCRVGKRLCWMKTAHKANHSRDDSGCDAGPTNRWRKGGEGEKSAQEPTEGSLEN